MRSFLLFLAFFVLTGCTQEFDDISNSKEFARYINKKYQLTEDLQMLSISTKKNGKIDFYVLDVNKDVKHRNPEVVSRSIIPEGSIIEIKRVLKCNNCFLGAPIKYSVKFIGDKNPIEKPVYLSFELRDDVESEELTKLQEK